MLSTLLILIIRYDTNNTFKRFSTHSIVETPHMAQLVPDCTTQMHFFVSSESSFCVLSDQSTVIGISKANENTIIKQNITDLSEPIVTYTANARRAFTLGVDEPQNVLLAGGPGCNYHGQVVQCDLTTGQAIKNFDRIGIGYIITNVNVNNLWFFGGHRSSMFAVIDSVSRQALGKPVESAVASIFPMTVSNIEETNARSKVLLWTVGNYPNYTENKSDMFDITALVNMDSDSLSKLFKSESYRVFCR